jgi:hypothetical protein
MAAVLIIAFEQIICPLFVPVGQWSEVQSLDLHEQVWPPCGQAASDFPWPAALRAFWCPAI